jgi:molybdenum ABC transporter molybdate-binding protein
MKRLAVVLRSALAIALVMSFEANAQDNLPVQLYAAGSLRAAMTELASAFRASGGPAVSTTYGPSGILRERIEKGEPAHVFASADMGNPEALAQTGLAAPATLFARNRLCALAPNDVIVSSDMLLDRMLDTRIKLGTSTPKADPSGDYAWQLFEKAETLRPGAYKTLDAKALKLTGGASTAAAPAGRSIYAAIIRDRKADLFLTYCTNALEAQREVPEIQMIEVPAELAVGASYGLTVISGAPPDAERFKAFVLSPEGQGILARHGFAPAAAP